MTENSNSIGTALGSALLYPLKIARLRTLGVGTVLMGLWLIFFILGRPPVNSVSVIARLGAISVAIPLTGYYVRIIQRIVDNQITPPTFGQKRSLLFLGLKGLIIFLVFQRPEILQIFLAPLGELAGEISRNSWIALIVVAYIYPAAIGTFIRSGSMLSAFNPQRISSVLIKPDYVPKAIIAVVITIGYIFILTFVTEFGISRIGLFQSILIFLLTSFFLFYLRMIQHHVIGQIWQNISLERTPNVASDSMADQVSALRELYEQGLLTSEEYETKRRALEQIDQAPELDAPERLKSLEELHTQNVLTEKELEEKQQTALAEATGRPVNPETEELDYTRRLEELHRLYESDVLTEEEYETKRQEFKDAEWVFEDADGRREDLSEIYEIESITRGESKPDVTRELEAIYHLHATGLLTDEEFEEKRRDVLRTVTVTDASIDNINVDRRRLEQFELLHRLYEQGLFTDDDYEQKQRLLESDRGEPEAIPSRADADVTARFETLHRLYKLGLLTNDEYEAKKQELLELV